MSGSALLFAALVAQPAMADAQLVSPPEASASPTIVEGLQPGGAIQGRVDTDERMTAAGVRTASSSTPGRKAQSCPELLPVNWAWRQGPTFW